MFNKLSIGLLNASGLNNSLDELMLYAQNNKTQLMFVTETYLLRNDFKTHWKQFHTYAQQPDGAARGFGGISCLIHPSFSSRYAIHKLSFTNPYTLSLKISSYTIHCLYLPPQLSLTTVEGILHSLTIDNHTIFLGDFNVRLGPITGDTRTNIRHEIFTNWYETNNLHLWNITEAYKQPTYQSTNGCSIIDFILTQPAQLPVHDFKIHDDESFGSDHLLVTSTILLPSPPTPLPLPNQTRRHWKLKRLEEIDVYKLYIETFEQQSQSIIQTITDIHTLQSYTQIEKIGKQINDAIYFSLDNSVTKTEIRPKHWKWFWTQELEDLAAEKTKKHIQWRKALRHHNDLRTASLWKQYDNLNNRFKSKLSQHRSSLWKQFCDELKTSDKNNINRYIKHRFKSTSYNTQYTSPAGPQQAVEDIKNHLETVFSGSHSNIRSPTTGFPFLEQEPIGKQFESTQIYFAILKELPSRKAPGSDHITAEMLRPIAHHLSKVLEPFLNLCFRHSWIPIAWRTAQVVPIYKKDDPNNPANYRPISLTSTFRKLLERLLLPDLLSNMHALDIAQGGFRRQRGVLDQAFNLHTLIQQYRQQYDQPPTLAFLDIKAAYDSVSRDLIWTTLRPQLPHRLYLLIKHMFDDIQLSVISNNYESASIYPRKGVLQGSILSPMLYAIFINSLPKVLRIGCTQPLLIRTLTPPRRPHTEDGILTIQRNSRRDKRLDRNITIINSLLYADDVALIGSSNDVVTMLRRAEQHSNQHQYKWHPTKSIIINPSESFTYSLYGQPLTIATTFKYLGIPFNKYGIQQSTLLQNNINKATLRMQQLRFFGVHMYSLGLLIAISAYSQFIRPILEFGLCLLDLNYQQKKNLQQAQTLCIKKSLNFKESSKPPTSIIEHITCLPTMLTRHHILQFKFLVRIHSLPPGLLTANILNSCLGKGTMLKYWKTTLKKNSLWTKLLTTTTITNINLNPPSSTEIFEINRQYKHDQQHQRQNAPTLQTIKQCRTSEVPSIDPILFIPCTSKERHRLIKWRMGWLIPKSSTPIACPCDSTTTISKKHFFRSCPLLHNDLELLDLLLKQHLTNYQRPELPATEIDLLLNRLPGTFHKLSTQHWQHTWPVLNQILFQLDKYSHPSAIFDDEPLHGQLVFVPCSDTESSSQDINIV
jgi:hypothetical protein